MPVLLRAAVPSPSAVAQTLPEGPQACVPALAHPSPLRLPGAGCPAGAADAAADVLPATRMHIWLHGGSCVMGSTAEWTRVGNRAGELSVSPWLADALLQAAECETPALRKRPLLAGCSLQRRWHLRAVHMTTLMGHCALMLKLMRAKAPSPPPIPMCTPQCHLADSGLSVSRTDAGRTACAGSLPASRSPAAGGWRLGVRRRAKALVMCTCLQTVNATDDAGFVR